MDGQLQKCLQNLFWLHKICPMARLQLFFGLVQALQRQSHNYLVKSTEGQSLFIFPLLCTPHFTREVLIRNTYCTHLFDVTNNSVAFTTLLGIKSTKAS